MCRVAMIRSYRFKRVVVSSMRDGEREREEESTLFIATASEGQSFIKRIAISGRTVR